MVSPTPAQPDCQLASNLVLALLGHGAFAPGRPEARPALAALSDSVVRRLGEVPMLALLGGRPSAPLDFQSWGFAAAGDDLGGQLPPESAPLLLPQLAAFCQDRRLLMITLLPGITAPEIDQLFYLLGSCGDRGPALRMRWLDGLSRTGLSHVSLIFVDDLCALDHAVPWPVQAALAWLRRDLNLLSLQRSPAKSHSTFGRQELLAAVLGIPSTSSELRDLLAYLDVLVDDLRDYDRDEFAYMLLERVEPSALSAVCLDLCRLLGSIQQRLEQRDDAGLRQRLEPLRWITRRVAEELQEKSLATPDHYHGLVLHKVLLYDEIPGPMRPMVSARQVLTSFLDNPARYFAEIEGSQHPDILEKRLWRLLEMMPNMVLAGRFDAVREVMAFVQRYGPTFELMRNPELLGQIREVTAQVLAEGGAERQVELMNTLRQMGRSGMHLLIDLTDHPQRAVRRAALDGLTEAGAAVVPVLFEARERKSGWHYLRNMLVILAKVGAGGPKVERVFREGLTHPEPSVRKEALPGLARSLRENAAGEVAGMIDDSDPEVMLRAVACLALTGIVDASVYDRLAGLLSARGRSDDAVMTVLTTINRLRPGAAAGERMEAALIDLAGGGGWLGIGKGATSQKLRVEAVKALGQYSSGRALRVLDKLAKENDAVIARTAREVLSRNG